MCYSLKVSRSCHGAWAIKESWADVKAVIGAPFLLCLGQVLPLAIADIDSLFQIPLKAKTYSCHPWSLSDAPEVWKQSDLRVPESMALHSASPYRQIKERDS